MQQCRDRDSKLKSRARSGETEHLHHGGQVDTDIAGVVRMHRPRNVATYLAISIPKLYRLLRSGRLVGAKVGGQWRISDEALRQYIEDSIAVRKLAARKK